ncbi:MAG: NnrS family protein [Rhodospirillaceae bacterium]|nr:NnrS family protein [Rhodospirillaceae bacterium]
MLAAEKSDTHPAAFLSIGFRPFFLFAGIYGVIPVIVWLLTYGGVMDLPGPLAPMLWHGHEMIFGFGVAAATGFLLTAVPNWTGTPPVQGPVLAGLAALWLAGRAVMWVGWPLGGFFVAALDLALIPAVAIVAGRRIASTGAGRNYVFLGLLAILFAGNLLMHLEAAGLAENTAATGLRIGVYGFALLITLIGGRVIPNFTANALKAAGNTAPVASHPTVEKLVVIGVLTATIAGITLESPNFIIGATALTAAALLAFRMRHWQTLHTRHQPILWVLHLGHIWLVIGFALMGLAALGGPVGESAAIHALTAGAMGTMILAMMTRAALGHTGRQVIASAPIVVSYAMASLGAILRVLATVGEALIGPSGPGLMIAAGGILWMLAFAIFTIVFWPILTGPRQ